MSLLRRVYRGAALLAIIHLALIGALVGIAASKGMLTADRIKAMVAAANPAPAPAQAAPAEGAAATQPSPAASPAPETETASPAEAVAPPDEVARRNLERQMLETSHQLVLANRQMVEVTRRREELERHQKELAEAHTADVEREQQAAFAKDLEVLALMKPKVALDNLLARPEDEAARLLFALDARKSKAVIEAASKDPAKWTRILSIQKKMHDVESEAPAAQQEAAKPNAKAASPSPKPAGAPAPAQSAQQFAAPKPAAAGKPAPTASPAPAKGKAP